MLCEYSCIGAILYVRELPVGQLLRVNLLVKIVRTFLNLDRCFQMALHLEVVLIYTPTHNV